MPPQAGPVPADALQTAPARLRLIGGAYVLCCGAILIASFLKSDWARNDFERFDNLPLLCLFFILCAGLCGAYATVYFQRRVPSDGFVVAIAGMCTALLLLSFPVGSRDVFAYAFMGKMWGQHHVNPYLVAPDQFREDPWFGLLSGKSFVPAGTPFSVYGPLFVAQTWLVDALAGRSLWAVVWMYKAWATVLWLSSVWVARAILQRGAGARAPRLFVLLVWNPLLWFEGAGQAHNDMAMALLLVGALWCWQTGRCTAAFALLAVSVWYKWYSIVFVPVFLIETWKLAGRRAAVGHALGCAAWLLLTGVVSLAPLPGALPAVAGEWLHPQKMSGIYPFELSPVLAALFWSFRALGLFSGPLGYALFNASRFSLFGVAAALVLVRQWRSPPAFAALVEACCLLGLAAFMLLITQLWPWHLVTVIVVGILCAREPFVLTAIVLTVLGMLSYYLTFAIAALALLLAVAALAALRWLSGRELYPRNLWDATP